MHPRPQQDFPPVSLDTERPPLNTPFEDHGPPAEPAPPPPAPRHGWAAGAPGAGWVGFANPTPVGTWNMSLFLPKEALLRLSLWRPDLVVWISDGAWLCSLSPYFLWCICVFSPTVIAAEPAAVNTKIPEACVWAPARLGLGSGRRAGGGRRLGLGPGWRASGEGRCVIVGLASRTTFGLARAGYSCLQLKAYYQSVSHHATTAAA